MISEEHFDELVRRHAGAVSAYARAVAPDRWTADDAFQETFLRAWKYLDSYRGGGSFEGWLIRICRNCLIDLAARQREELFDAPPEQAELLGISPARLDVSHETHELLYALPIEQREVVALCGLLGYDYASAAELLGIPIGTVRSRLHRARATLRACLEDGGTAGVA